MRLQDYTYWNTRTYGRAVRLHRRWIRGTFLLLCLLTPCTNWMIPFIKKIVRNSLVIRYEIMKS